MKTFDGMCRPTAQGTIYNTMEYHALTEADLEVLRRAVAASQRLYVQGIQEVGAAVRTRTGEIFSGIHFETATGFANPGEPLGS